MSNESSEHELPIRDGGEDMRIFDIMDRFRGDGSCERIIQTALIQMAKAQHAEADAQREPELSNAEIAEKVVRDFENDRGSYVNARPRKILVESITTALDAKDTRSRPTVEAAASFSCPICQRGFVTSNDLVVHMQKSRKCRIVPASEPSVEAAEIRIQAFDEMIQVIPTSWLDPILTGPDKVLKTQPGTWGCTDIVDVLQAVRDRITAARDAAPIPSEPPKNLEIETRG